MADANLFRLMGESKICSKCSESKPRSEFNKLRGKERAYCKVCHVASAAKWASDNKEKRRAYQRKWVAENRDKAREYGRKTYSRMPEAAKEKKRAYRKKRHLERKYGITQDEWQRMFDAQGGVCALCQVPGRTGKHGKLAVDHCHETGRVRGLLCTPCNVSIGILGETAERLQRVVSYLKCEPV